MGLTLVVIVLVGFAYAMFRERRLDRYIGLAFVTIGLAGLIALEAIGVARELVREVGNVEVRTTVELK